MLCTGEGTFCFIIGVHKVKSIQMSFCYIKVPPQPCLFELTSESILCWFLKWCYFYYPESRHGWLNLLGEKYKIWCTKQSVKYGGCNYVYCSNFLSFKIFSGKTPRIRNQLNVCQQLMVQLSTQSAPEFSDIVDSSGLPHKLLQILTLGPSMCFDEKSL